MALLHRHLLRLVSPSHPLCPKIFRRCLSFIGFERVLLLSHHLHRHVGLHAAHHLGSGTVGRVGSRHHLGRLFAGHHWQYCHLSHCLRLFPSLWQRGWLWLLFLGHLRWHRQCLSGLIRCNLEWFWFVCDTFPRTLYLYYSLHCYYHCMYTLLSTYTKRCNVIHCIYRENVIFNRIPNC